MARDSGRDAIETASRHYYNTCELYEDEDLDSDDHAEVVRRAFTSSDCQDFAYVLALVTGWEVACMTWLTRHGDVGHHYLARSPEGRLLDVTGWTDERSLE